MMDLKPDKAKIRNLTDGGEIECQFNPKQFKLTKKNTWSKKDKQGEELSALKFGGGNPATISMELFFDTTHTGADVRTQTNKLLDMMRISPKLIDPKTQKGEPPRVQFQWGKILAFVAVLADVNLTFTMFLSNGTPVRATATVNFQQYDNAAEFPSQNPTSRSAARKVRVVVEGETLSWIAYQEYGDPSHWRHIADTNGLTSPHMLQPGQVLNLVPLP